MKSITVEFYVLTHSTARDEWETFTFTENDINFDNLDGEISKKHREWMLEQGIEASIIVINRDANEKSKLL